MTMRFFLVLFIWVIIVGGLWSYITHRDARRQQVIPQAAKDLAIDGRFAIAITPTFSAEKDPFALTTTESDTPPLEIRLNGTPLELPSREVRRGEIILLESITGMLTGHNEIYVNASPPLSESTLQNGVRVEVFEDEVTIAETTVWAGEGALVSGTLSFNHGRKAEGGHDR